MNPNLNEIFDSAHGWLTLLIGGIMAALSIVSWCFSTFETQAHSKENKEQVDKRLSRIEDKIDILLTR